MPKETLQQKLAQLGKKLDQTGKTAQESLDFARGVLGAGEQVLEELGKIKEESNDRVKSAAFLGFLKGKTQRTDQD